MLLATEAEREIMRKSITIKAGAFGTAVALAGGLAVISSGTTGAYFSDTKSGEIKGTIGSIQISTTGSTGSGPDNLSFSFVDLMPGEVQTATVNYKNTGKKAQDIYLTFPNVPALHALNNLGSYGEVLVVAADGTTAFQSKNLQDGRHQVAKTSTNPGSTTTNTCGPFSETGCWPLPDKIKVATNVAPGGEGSVSFSFNYPAKMSGTGLHPDGSAGVFNTYPLSGLDVFLGEAGAADAGILPVVAPDNGLPVNVVAVQVGKTP